jgi:hypothetical protein
LLDYSHQILELFLVLASVPVAIAIRDDCGREVTEYPRARCLDGVNKGRREEKFNQRIADWVMVEKREKSPMNQPCPVLQLGKWVVV